MISEEATKLADLPAKWEAEATEIDERLESKEVTGEVWTARSEILWENAVELREAIYAEQQEQDHIPSSIHRLADWLLQHGYPQDPRPETNDIGDWALAKLQELQKIVDEKE